MKIDIRVYKNGEKGKEKKKKVTDSRAKSRKAAV